LTYTEERIYTSSRFKPLGREHQNPENENEEKKNQAQDQNRQKRIMRTLHHMSCILSDNAPEQPKKSSNFVDFVRTQRVMYSQGEKKNDWGIDEMRLIDRWSKSTSIVLVIGMIFHKENAGERQVIVAAVKVKVEEG